MDVLIHNSYRLDSSRREFLDALERSYEMITPKEFYAEVKQVRTEQKAFNEDLEDAEEEIPLLNFHYSNATVIEFLDAVEAESGISFRPQLKAMGFEGIKNEHYCPEDELVVAGYGNPQGKQEKFVRASQVRCLNGEYKERVDDTLIRQFTDTSVRGDQDASSLPRLFKTVKVMWELHLEGAQNQEKPLEQT